MAVVRRGGGLTPGLAAADAFGGELACTLAAKNARDFPREHDPNFLLLHRALDYLHHRGARPGARRPMAMRAAALACWLLPPLAAAQPALNVPPPQ